MYFSCINGKCAVIGDIQAMCNHYETVHSEPPSDINRYSNVKLPANVGKECICPICASIQYSANQISEHISISHSWAKQLVCIAKSLGKKESNAIMRKWFMDNAQNNKELIQSAIAIED